MEINSRKLGRKLIFSQPGGGYIYVDLNGKPGSLGTQICRGGKIFGDTISYTGSEEVRFEKICRAWYRGYLARYGSDY